MNYKIITKFSDLPVQTRNNLENDFDNFNIFQSEEIVDFYYRSENWTPIFTGVKDENGLCKGYLVSILQKEGKGFKGYLSSRAIVFAGPLIDKSLPIEEQEIVMELILQNLIKQVKKKSIYIQFRNFFYVDNFRDVFKKYEFEYHEHLNFRVNTADKDKTWGQISKSKKRQIKQSFKQGAEIIEPENIGQVKEYYLILKDLYKTKVKKPLPSWEFFKNFYEYSLKSKLGKFFLVKYNGNIIGGIMCPITPRKVIYEWYICGLDGKFKGVYPSILATWAAIDYASKNEFEYFDFMGAGKPDDDYGVREFKSKFGGELVEFGRFEKINKPILYKLGKFGIKVLGTLK